MDYVLESTGTTRGSGFVVGWLKCPRKAALDYIDSQTREKKLEWERNPEQGKPQKLVVGSLVHLFLRLYYGGTPFSTLEDRIVWENGTPVAVTHPLSHKEATRLWLEYKLQSSPDDLGVPRGFEIPLDLVLRISDDDYYRCSGAADRDADILDTHVAEMRKRFGLDLEPGYYLVDDKTESRNQEDFAAHFEMSLQFKYYLFLAEQMHGVPIKGMLVNVFVKKKAPERHVLLVRGLTDDDRQMVLSMIQKAPTQKTLDALVAGTVQPETFMANPSNCESYGQVCYWYRSGRCKRY